MTQILSVQQKAAPAEGFDDFVKSSSKLSPFNGSPGVGQFRSEITNRASIPDITRDLGALMGIDRIQAFKLVEMIGEYGLNGERVYSHTNDKQGRFRFVGLFQNANDNNGQAIVFSVGSTNSFIEVVFYGTGLNWLIGLYSGYGFTGTYSVDGGSEVALGNPASVSSVINVRNYNPNNLIPVVSGLPLGLHTVKIKRTDGGGNSVYFHGFEILNESSTLSVKPGTGYSRGREVVLSVLQSIAHNSTFDSGSLGTRGGRVVAYLKANGTIGKSATPVDPVQGNLTGASHANEEITRIYNFREFGMSRADDFSTLTGSVSSRAFTLEDGTTTLVGNGSSVDLWGGLIETLSVTNGTGNFITLTFIGTGLDLILFGDSSTRGFTVSIDGSASIGQIDVDTTTNNNSRRTFKVVSGLPYGTHVVRLSNANGGLAAPGIRSFIVYQPKKPTLPTGAIELVDYNVMADYSHAGATSQAVSPGHIQKPTGVLSKHALREFIYSGTWSIDQTNQAIDTPSGFRVFSATNASYIEYTFFGTGIVPHLQINSTNNIDFSVMIDGVLNAGGADITAGAFPLGGGSYRLGGTSNGTARLAFTGLALGLHKIRITLTVTSGFNFNIVGMDVITPIHSPKTSIAATQNTSPIGSCGLVDTRKLGPVKSESAEKYRGFAQGTVASPTTTSTAFIPLDDMSLIVPSKGGWFDIMSVVHTYSTVHMYIALFLNGIQVNPGTEQNHHSANEDSISITALVYLPEGTHKLDVFWRASAGTAQSFFKQRMMTVKEL